MGNSHIDTPKNTYAMLIITNRTSDNLININSKEYNMNDEKLIQKCTASDKLNITNGKNTLDIDLKKNHMYMIEIRDNGIVYEYKLLEVKFSNIENLVEIIQAYKNWMKIRIKYPNKNSLSIVSL